MANLIAVYAGGSHHAHMRVSNVLSNVTARRQRARGTHPNFKQIDPGLALRLIGDRSLPMAEIARRLGISVKTLYKKFPVAALRQGYRCNSKPFDAREAQRLLQDPTRTVKAVAARFGVSDTTLRKRLPVAAMRGGHHANSKPFDHAEARRLLLCSSIPVTEVARRVGISVATLYTHLPVAEIRRERDHQNAGPSAPACPA